MGLLALFTSADEQIVPIYVDGVYQIGMTAGLFKLNSIDRNEVLRGPQGTLFGRNAMGGAINMVTRDPGFAKPTAELRLGYGRFNDVRVDFYRSTPLSETLAANISVLRQKDRGFARDIVRGTNEAASRTTAVRAKRLWKPSEALSAKIIGFYMNAGDAAGVASFPLNGSTAARRFDPTVVSVALWGSNLTNSRRLRAVAESAGADRVSRVRPISYGVETRFKF